MWHYVYFFAYLKDQKGKDAELSFVELELRKKVRYEEPESY